jgi:hypothetical protein
MTKRPEKFIFNPGTEAGEEILKLVDQYRVLMGLTWHDFCYIGFSMVIREDNEDLADHVLTYVKTRRRPGRPVGSGLKSRMRRAGVDPNEIQNNYL